MTILATRTPHTEPPPVVLVMDPRDDAVHTHTALAAHHPAAGRITLHPGPGPGTASDTALAHDLFAALGKPPLLPGRFPSGRQPDWEAATAWIHAMPTARLTVLRAHRLTARRIERLLHLCALTGIHLTLVCHRPHLAAALHQALHTTAHTLASDLDTARRHYYGTPSPPADVPPFTALPRRAADRWMTLPALDRLVSYDSPRPCRSTCTPPPIDWRHRPPPQPLAPATARKVIGRLHAATAHPRLAAGLITTLLTGASFQQLTTVRTDDIDEDAATLAFHDHARYTDGCATHSIPPWARPFVRAAACFATLTDAPDRQLLACQGDRPQLLCLAESAKLRPPQPPASQRTGRGRVVWDWKERKEAERYEPLLAAHSRPAPSPTSGPGTHSRC